MKTENSDGQTTDQRRLGSAEVVNTAWLRGLVVPAFNIPYLPMMRHVVRALHDTNSFGLIMVARLEWVKFGAIGLETIKNEYDKFKNDRHTRLHLDHVPVIDEDNMRVDYRAIIKKAIKLGYQSVMVDGSRLPLQENIECTRGIVEIAHETGIPVEAELGTVMGHEVGHLPYDEIFASGNGFTDPEEASEFVGKTGVDWLSVAIGNIHGAISGSAKDKKKISARLNIDHLKRISQKTRIPLVLHGGTGISGNFIREGIESGIAKINVATAIRQPYEQGLKKSSTVAQKAVYDAVINIIRNELEISGSSALFN